MNELFPVESVASESPRLKWMKQHDVCTHFATHMQQPGEKPWCAWLPEFDDPTRGIPSDPDLCGYGATEDDALADLAINQGLKLWNEVGA